MRSSSPNQFTSSSSYYYYPAPSSSSSSPSTTKSKSKSKHETHHRPASLHSNPRPKSIDMSRLLDPAYLPSTSRAHPNHPSHRHQSPSNVSVFIDTNGDAHDPDYRHFPISTSPTSPRRRRHPRTTGLFGSGYGDTSIRRGPWYDEADEYDEDEDALEDGEDEEDDSEPFFLSSEPHPQNGARYKVGAAAAYRRRRRSLPGSSYGGTSYGATSAYGGSSYGTSNTTYDRPSTTMSMRNSPIGRKRDGSFSTTTTSSGSAANAYFSSFMAHSPATTASSMGTSWESEKGVLGRFWRGARGQTQTQSEGEGEGEEKEKDEKKGGCVMKKIRRLSRGDKEKGKEDDPIPSVYRASDEFAYSRPLPIAEEEKYPPTSVVNAVNDEQEEEDEDAVRERERKEREDYVPTCGQSLRRQWAAISLSFRFSIFRAQRRISRRVNSFR